MKQSPIRNTVAVIALLALSACAARGSREMQAQVDSCPPTQTMTCDRFSGENYNCSCEQGDRLQDMLDVY